MRGCWAFQAPNNLNFPCNTSNVCPGLNHSFSLYYALQCVSMTSQSRTSTSLRTWQHEQYIFIMLPPAGRHLETGATEDCSLSLNCVWDHFNSVE